MSSAEPPRRSRFPRKFAGLALLLGAILLVAVVFRHVLVPFVLALILVYLIEPIVKRLARLRLGPLRTPRWVAVIIVYLVSAGLVTLFTIAAVPPLSREISNLAEEAPRFLEEVREEHIPEWNAEVQGLLERIFPQRMTASHVEAARSDLHDALARADALALILGGMTPEERALYSSGGVDIFFEDEGPDDEVESTFGARFDEASGEWQVQLHEIELVPHPDIENAYVIRGPLGDDAGEPDAPLILDLEQSLDEALTSLVELSGQGLSKVLSFGQDLIIALLSAFFGIFLTFMLAAFISIDLPHILAYFRGRVPPDSRGGWDELLRRLDKGLAGVVRGQILICLVNGVLTLIGLLLFEVKFAFTLATLATMLSLIPIFGTIISTIPIVAMALPGGLSVGLAVLLWILMIHFIEANFLNPKIIGSSAHIHPAVVIFALIAGEHTFGLLGALLAVPTASILLTLLGWVLDKIGPNEAAATPPGKGPSDAGAVAAESAP